MQPETEQILGTLEVIIEPNSNFNLPGHEDGGYISPFVWEVSEYGEFNILKLSIIKDWLKLTDVDKTIAGWQEMEYLSIFNNFGFEKDEKNNRSNKIKALFEILSDKLQDLESFDLKVSCYLSPNTSIGIIVGKTIDSDWICVCPTIYKETEISQQQIFRSEQLQSISTKPLNENTLTLVSEIKAITLELGTIHLEGDFGGGYYYSYEHQIVYAAAETKERAIEITLQASGMLEISKFHNFYPDKQYFQNENSGSETKYLKYQQVNKFLASTFPEVMMYRFSFLTEENIYIIGKVLGGDWAGLYLESEFVYNP
ncbi:nuclease A inhibitor family protein [Nostoc sp. GT001]|uniref:nuclease A inhibitor family protein n=1 Tax=Nostoc sp. GT001 TaxID=3056647 RepID=UPI0025AB1C0B|nr:nuclease A inhibitor family protein [Nostoc sp. GT001]MDM9584588.1 nuclease A inhibitor family protein [Nostoc sp. GT001]